jgi:hypothetical protein
MTMDLTVQQNGYDIRERGTRVRLLPEVVEVRYNARKGGIEVVRGGRDKIASALRGAGYEVIWLDDNPAVVLGAMTSDKKAAAARRNGAMHKGTKRKAAKPTQTTAR